MRLLLATQIMEPLLTQVASQLAMYVLLSTPYDLAIGDTQVMESNPDNSDNGASVNPGM